MLVDEIVRNGGDIYTEYFPGKFADVANAFKVTRATVINLGQRLHLCAEREAHNPERSIRTLGFFTAFSGTGSFLFTCCYSASLFEIILSQKEALSILFEVRAILTYGGDVFSEFYMCYKSYLLDYIVFFR